MYNRNILYILIPCATNGTRRRVLERVSCPFRKTAKEKGNRYVPNCVKGKESHIDDWYFGAPKRKDENEQEYRPRTFVLSHEIRASAYAPGTRIRHFIEYFQMYNILTPDIAREIYKGLGPGHDAEKLYIHDVVRTFNELTGSRDWIIVT